MAEDANEKIREFLSTAMKRLQAAIDADQHNRTEAIDSLEFLEGINQWDSAELNRRKRAMRPALTINLLPKYVDQVVGDMRQNKVRIKIQPSSPNANTHIAQIRQGLIQDIEYASNAEYIYDQAGESVAGCGYGAWRVLHRYTEDDPFLQELYIENIPNPFSVYYDPNSKDPMYSDAKYCFIVDKMEHDVFKERYPGKDLPISNPVMADGVDSTVWWSTDTVTVAEYYLVHKEKVTMCLMSDGTKLTKKQAEEKIKQWEERKLEKPDLEVPEIEQEREVENKSIKHYVVTATEIISDGGIDGEDVPGSFIPVVMVHGKERNIKGKRYIRGMVKDAKDPQRLVNYWNTSAAETVALAPKSQWVGTARQFEGYEGDYAVAHIENLPYLKYNVDTAENGMPIPPPQRQQPSNPPIAILSEIERAERNVQGTVGMSDRDTMASGPERTGAAVINAKSPSDVGSYAYIDNLHRGITHTGKILNSAIPYIYDSARDVRIRNWDTTEYVVPINTPIRNAIQSMQQDPGRYSGFDAKGIKDLKEKAISTPNAMFNDLNEGTYSVVSSTGPSFSTQRAEASQIMLALSQTNPKLFDVGGDLMVKNMDFLYADELSSRLRKTLPQGLTPLQEGETPPPPPPPSPADVVAMKKIEVEEKRIEVQKLRYIREIAETKGEMRKVFLEMMEEVLNGVDENGTEVK